MVIEAPAGEEEINNTMQSLSDLGGGTLTLSEGTFIIDGPINLISNMIMQGQGANTIIKLADGVNQDMPLLQGENVSNVIIRNLVIDGNKENQATGTNHAILLNYFENITIEKTIIQNCTGNGIRITGEYSIGHIVKIQNNIINNNNGNGISCTWAQDSEIINNTIKLNGGVGINIGGYCDRIIIGVNHMIANNQNNDGNSHIETWSFINEIKISDNICRAGYETYKPVYGVYIHQTGSPLDGNVLIINNDLYQSGIDAAIRNDNPNTNFGAGNRVNDGTWIVGPDYTL